MKKCIYCNAELKDKARFCDECGAEQVLQDVLSITNNEKNDVKIEKKYSNKSFIISIYVILIVAIIGALIAVVVVNYTNDKKVDNNELVQIAGKAIKVTDEFLDAELTSDEAEEKLDLLHDRAETEAEKYADGNLHIESLLIESDIQLIYWDIQKSDMWRSSAKTKNISDITKKKEDLESHLEDYKKALKKQD